jgi:hypothetical protein
VQRLYEAMDVREDDGGAASASHLATVTTLVPRQHA